MKRIAIAILTVAVVGAILFTGCVGAPPPAAPPAAPTPPPSPAPPAPPAPPPTTESLTYTNSEYGFLVEYPKDWDFQEGLVGTIVMFAGPFIMEEEYMINMNILAEELPEFPKMTVEDYAGVGEMQLKRVADYYEKVDEHSATIDDLPAIVRSYIADFEGVRQMQTQAYFLKENVAYVITYSAPVEFHDEYADCFGLVIGTFRFE